MNDRYWVLLCHILYSTRCSLAHISSVHGAQPLQSCQDYIGNAVDRNRFFVVHDIEYQRMWKEYL